EEPVREVGHQVPDLGEAQRTGEQHEQDGARPTLADQRNRSVIELAALAATGYCSLFRGPGVAVDLRHRARGHPAMLDAHAACATRAFSLEPSRGRSPARVTRLVKVPSATCATA